MDSLFELINEYYLISVIFGGAFFLVTIAGGYGLVKSLEALKVTDES
jgi:hypothetical protein